MVYILNKNGEPLMPTKRYGKIRRLLDAKQAKVIRRCPFTVQLLYDTSNITQPIVLGVDAGSKVAGLSAATSKEELYAAECSLRTDIVNNLSERRQYRRARRNRKTRYRKPRFNNRRRTGGWLAPSIQRKIDTHLRLISDIQNLLPITSIIVEVASFDIQKIKDPSISGAKYQQGEQLGFWNVREFVLFRDGHKCMCCKGKSGDIILSVHHIESRRIGGDAPNNLITFCETCHNGLHKKKIESSVKRGTSYRDAAFMGVMRWALYEKLKKLYPSVTLTYGYITKNTRITNGLEKTHAVDARCITGNPQAAPSGNRYLQRAVRGKNRQIHKVTIYKGGRRRAAQAQKILFGFRLNDKVKLPAGIVGFIGGRRLSGIFLIRAIDGSKVTEITYKKLDLLEMRRTILTVTI